MRRCRWRGLSRWLLLVAAVMPLMMEPGALVYL